MTDAPHYVYVIRVADTDIHKIGLARDPLRRLANLQSGNHQPLYLIHTTSCPSREQAASLEKAIHEELSSEHCRGEWFEAPQERILRAIFFRIEFPNGNNGIWGNMWADPGPSPGDDDYVSDDVFIGPRRK